MIEGDRSPKSPLGAQQNRKKSRARLLSIWSSVTSGERNCSISTTPQLDWCISTKIKEVKIKKVVRPTDGSLDPILN